MGLESTEKNGQESPMRRSVRLFRRRPEARRWSPGLADRQGLGCVVVLADGMVVIAALPKAKSAEGAKLGTALAIQREHIDISATNARKLVQGNDPRPAHIICILFHAPTPQSTCELRAQKIGLPNGARRVKRRGWLPVGPSRSHQAGRKSRSRLGSRWGLASPSWP